MANLNLEVFRSINGWPDGLSPFLPFFSTAMNHWWVKVAFVALFVGMVYRPGRPRGAAIRAVIAVLLANGATDLFKRFDGMPRPCSELSSVALHGIGCAPSMGTASAHSANMAAVATVFVIWLGWWGSPWVAVAVLTGLSRIYIGAHYPYQVLLGMGCGVVAAVLVSLVRIDSSVTSGSTHDPAEPYTDHEQAR